MAVKARPPVKLQISKSSGHSFATGVAIAPIDKQPEPTCPFCGCKHTLELCKPFLEETHRNKLNFVKTKGICFGCLSMGHISRDCKRRLTSPVCRQVHPSVLHVNGREGATKETERLSGAVSRASEELCGHIGVGE